jgi:hypothetical protein
MTLIVGAIGLLATLLVLAPVSLAADTFEAELSGRQEVAGTAPFLAPQPGIDTETVGRIRLVFDPALTRAEFRLRVRDGLAITQAHLHCAFAGVNGPIVAFLFGLVAPGVNVSGLLSEGELTNASFQGGVDCTGTCGKSVNNIASLRGAILDGCIYANVHSEANPGGEVRGQLRQRP